MRNAQTLWVRWLVLLGIQLVAALPAWAFLANPGDAARVAVGLGISWLAMTSSSATETTVESSSGTLLMLSVLAIGTSVVTLTLRGLTGDQFLLDLHVLAAGGWLGGVLWVRHHFVHEMKDAQLSRIVRQLGKLNGLSPRERRLILLELAQQPSPSAVEVIAAAIPANELCIAVRRMPEGPRLLLSLPSPSYTSSVAFADELVATWLRLGREPAELAAAVTAREPVAGPILDRARWGHGE